MDDQRNILIHNTLRSALYHASRERAHLFSRQVTDFAFILLAVCAAGQTTPFGLSAHWFGYAAAIIGALALVLNFSGKAAEHRTLKRDYYRLLAEIARTPTPDAGTFADWEAQILHITADEPPVLRALDAKAYNDATDALEAFPQDDRLIVPWWQRGLLGHLLTFEGYNYRKVSEG